MIKALIMDIGGILSPDIWEHLFLSKERISSFESVPKDTLQVVGAKYFALFAYRVWDRAISWQKLERIYWELVAAELNVTLNLAEVEQKTEDAIVSLIEMARLKEFAITSSMRIVFCSNETPFWFMRQKDKLAWDAVCRSDAFMMSFVFGESKSDSRATMFRACVDYLQTPPAETLFIDNQHGNIQQAKNFGFRALRFQSHKRENNLVKLLKAMSRSEEGSND